VDLLLRGRKGRDGREREGREKGNGSRGEGRVGFHANPPPIHISGSTPDR